ncbi:MAG: EAL domain-containing protein [Alphaproteobacteria bacterium]
MRDKAGTASSADAIPSEIARFSAIFHEFIGTPKGLTEDEAGRLRAQQIAALLRLTPFMMGANVFAAIATAIVFWSPEHASFVGLWVAVFLFVALRGVWTSVKAGRRGAPRTVSARAIRMVIVNVMAPAILWGLVPVMLFASSDASEKLLLSSLVTGTICVGVLGVSTVPLAACVYAVTIALCACIAMALAGEGGYLIFAGFLFLYVAITVLCVGWFSRLFNDRFLNMLELERQSELIGILMHDFEEHTSDWLWETSTSGELTMVSGRFGEVVRQPREALIGRTLLSFLSDRGTDESRRRGKSSHETLAEMMGRRAAFGDAEVAVMIGGEERWWSLSGKPVTDHTGQFRGYRGVGSDITDEKRNEVQIDHMAHHDALTDLPNRVQFQSTLEDRLERAKQSGAEFALLFIDLDDFKAINDTLGHSAGDQLLIQATERLLALMPANGFVARLGGDEFAVILDTDGAPHRVTKIAERMIEVLREPFKVVGSTVQVGASIGIAFAPDDAADPDHLLRRADLALYRAKADGRGVARAFTPEIETTLTHRRQIEDDLSLAISRGELQVHYQPIIELETGRVTGAEALLRWTHATLGSIPPSVFVPIAEASGLIVPIGEWVLNRACRDAANWPKDMTIAVNISPVQFKSRRLASSIVAALAASGLSASRLEIEITETVLLDEAAARDVISQLLVLGVHLSLDDFGTGYSSLSYLRLFPFHKIKVDQSFVREAVGRPDCVVIVATIADLGRKLGTSVTAEGIETTSELAIAVGAGCTLGQGYHFGRPMPKEAFEAMMAGGELVSTQPEQAA